MSSRFRQPFHFEPGYEDHQRRLQEVEATLPEVSMPPWAFGALTANGGEHDHARRAIGKMAQRHMDHAAKQGVEITYEEAEAAGRACAYRYDDRNDN